MSSLDSVWKSYELARDSMNVARKVVAKAIASEPGFDEVLFRTNFAGETPDVLDPAQDEVNELFILALWVVFERELRDHLRAEGTRPLGDCGTPFHLGLSSHLQKEIDYWKNDDVLDLFKTIADPDIIGQAKQIKEYRDWVAHKSRPRRSQTNITPKFAYDTLSEIIRAIVQTPDTESNLTGPVTS